MNTGLRQSISGGPSAVVTFAFLEYTTVASTSSFTLRAAGTVDYEVDWGDGTVQSYTTTAPTHTYSTAGTYTIKITPAVGTTYRPNFNNNVSDTSIAEVAGTGGSQLGANLDNSWKGAINMTSFSSNIDVSGVTKFNSTWRDASSLTSFPLIDTSSGGGFNATWRDCNSLTSFPALDFSSANNFDNAWRGCTSLQDFPANMFDSCGTLSNINAFRNAWFNCALTAQSIENILVSLDTNGVTNKATGFDGGTNAGKSTWSTAANDAYDNLIADGWTITYNA